MEEQIRQSSLSINRIQNSINFFGMHLRTATNHVFNLNRTLGQRKQNLKNNIRAERLTYFKKRELMQKRNAEEKLESQKTNLNIQERGKKTIANSRKGFLGRVLDFIAITTITWLLLNYKKIIGLAQGFFQRMTKVIGVLKGFVEGVTGMLTGIGKSLSGFFGQIIDFNEDFIKEDTQIRTQLNRVNNNVTRMEQDLNNSMQALSEWTLETSNAEEGDAEEKDTLETLRTTGVSPFGDEQKDIDTKPVDTKSWKPLLDLIGEVESPNSGYNAIAPNDKNLRLSSMTIAEAAKAIGENGGKGAIGKYQLTNPIEQAALAGLGPDDIFSPENQDAIALALIKDRGVTLEMVRENPTEAGNLLSKVWSGLPALSDFEGAKRGESFYKGVGNNKAGTSAERFEAVLKNVAKSSAKQIQQEQVIGDKNFFGAQQGRKGYSNQWWDFWDWTPDDILNTPHGKNNDELGKLIDNQMIERMNLDNKLKKERVAQTIFVPETSGSSGNTSTLSTQSTTSTITASSKKSLNSGDILLRELAYT